MRKDFNIFVEGVADECFIKQYIRHVFGKEVPDERIVPLNGWGSLKTEASALRMRSMTANGGINLVIVDADNDFQARIDEIAKWQQANEVEFELFLMPNDKDTGELETLLENIINPNNEPIFKCWDKYEKELGQIKIKGRTTPLTIPGKKAKIYAYLSALLGRSDDEQKLAQIGKRDYANSHHWNLDAKYLEPLKEFLNNNLL